MKAPRRNVQFVPVLGTTLVIDNEVCTVVEILSQTNYVAENLEGTQFDCNITQENIFCASDFRASLFVEYLRLSRMVISWREKGGKELWEKRYISHKRTMLQFEKETSSEKNLYKGLSLMERQMNDTIQCEYKGELLTIPYRG